MARPITAEIINQHGGHIHQKPNYNANLYAAEEKKTYRLPTRYSRWLAFKPDCQLKIKGNKITKTVLN